MERAAWTDERLGDLADATRTGFARIDQDIRDLRAEMHHGFNGLRGEMHEGDAGLRGEMQDGFRSIWRAMLAVGGGMIVALIGVIGAVLSRGA